MGPRRPRPASVPPAGPPHRVRVPVNVHDWERISFLHWPVDPSALDGLLPRELAPLTFESRAWVGVTPFFIRVRPPGLPAIEGLSAFPETNVRTYVAGPDGREGLWFLRMEVPSAWFTATLRSIGLPYVRRRMTVDADGSRISYRSRQGDGRTSHEVVVRAGTSLAPPSGGPLERFLTARWGAYHRRGPFLLYTPVQHPPWRLQAAGVEACVVAPLLRDAGLSVPDEPPLAHFSPGVTVRVGPPRLVRGTAAGHG